MFLFTVIHSKLCHICVSVLQKTSDVSVQARQVPMNHPYIGVVAGDSTLSFFVITERLVLFSTGSFLKALKGLMAAYYVFNIEYPKGLNMPLLFIQHFVLCIKEEILPQALIRFITSLDKL